MTALCLADAGCCISIFSPSPRWTSRAPMGSAQVTQEALAEHGAVSTVEIASGEKAELLGRELDRVSGRWRVRPKRFWRLMGALDYLLNAEGLKVSGRELERIPGRIVATCMLRRE